MNRILTPLVFAFGTSSLLLMDSAIKGSVILLGAACVAVMLKRDSAAMRHLVWLVAIVSMLVVPVFSVLLPRWQVLPAWAAISQSSPAIETSNRAVELPRTFEAASADSPEPFDPGEFESQRDAIDTSFNSEALEQPRIEATQNDVGIDRATHDPSWSWISILPILWSIGFGVLLLRLMAARWMLWSNEQRASVIGVSGCSHDARKPMQHESDAAIVAAFENAYRQLGIRQRIQLLIDSERTIPVVWGIVRCRLMLPATARQWSDEQLQSVLLHELAHIKRRDTLVQLLTQMACALHWFNPLVWFAAWRLDVERERSCDDLVLASGIKPSAYAAHLLDVVTGLTPARWTQACGLAMARKSSLEGRLTAVLGKDLNRRGVSLALAGVGLFIAVGIAVPIAMLRGAQPVETNLDANTMNSEPKDDKSKALFESWKASARTDGKIPGGRIGELATELKTRIVLNLGSQTAVGWEEALKKCDVTRDWSPSEAATLLDEIEVAVPGLAESAMWTNMERRVHFGKKLPDELKDAPWGSPQAQGEQLDASSLALRGLRIAWLLEPKEESYALGGVLKSRVLFHNTGKIPVCFATENWIQSGMHTAKDAAGKEISVWATQRLGERTRMIFRLAPGEYAEVQGHSIGIGSHESATKIRTQQAGAWIEAKPGDLVTFLPGKLHVSFQTWQKNEGRKDSTTAWNETIAARVSQEGPWPTSVADRELLIERVTRDLVIQLSTEGSKGELLRDNSSDGLAKLTAQLQAVGASMHFSGELSSGETTFKVTEARPEVAMVIRPADEPQAIMPKQKDARALYEVWQRYARANGDIPGALVGELAASVNQFIKYNPTWETVPKLNAILPRLDATRDWKPAEAIALLDDVAGIQDSPLSPAPWKGTRDTIRQGDTLPEKYTDVAWGEEQANGLRASWVLEPSAAEHRIGTALKARLLVQNRGQVPVMLQVPTFHQGWVKGTDAKGSEVQVSGIEWTTRALLNTVRLAPGEYIEINTPGVGIGPRAGMGPWAGPRVGSNVLAKAGDELTLTHGLVPLDGSEVGVSEDDPHVSGPGWWLAHIKTRLNRELPLPADAAERTRMLDRAVRELFATAPTAEETEAFIADKTPNAIDALAKRLAARTDAVSFSGKLPTVPVKFRVLDADENADKQPRVVLGPGEYPLPSTTATRGDVTLKIVGRPVGDRRTNDAQILFEATEATGRLPPDPYKLEVPDGWRTWAIVCRPSEGFFYLLHKGAVRKIDYSDPGNVTDLPANDLPTEFRDEVKRQLDIAGVSAEAQAEVFEKPAPPAALPDPKTSASTTAKRTGAGASKFVKLSEKDYTKIGVHCQKFVKEDAKRPDGRLMGRILDPTKLVDGPLVLGLRVANDANWRIGSETRVELVVRNQSQEDVKFAQTLQSDVGLSVVAIDKDGKEYPAKIAPSDTGLLVFNRLLLPKNGYVTMVKSFTIRFDAEERFDSDLNVAAFHLPPGDYKLRCKWNDAHPNVAYEGEWTGELVNEELEFTLAEAVTPPPTSEAAKTKEQEPITAWGQEVGGLQAGLCITNTNDICIGGKVKAVVKLRNVSKETISVTPVPLWMLFGPTKVVDFQDKPVRTTGGPYPLLHIGLKKLTLKPGDVVDVDKTEIPVAELNQEVEVPDQVADRQIIHVEPGKYKVNCTGFVQEHSELSTGSAEFEAKAAMVRLEMKGTGADGKPVVLMSFEELQRDAATSTVRIKSVDGGGGSVGSPMFIVRGACEIAKARGAAYFANLKEWDAEDGTGMYLIGFSKKQDIRPLTSDRQLQIFAVGHFDFLFKDPAAADADKPQEKLAELDAKIGALKMERVKLSESLAPTHPNIRTLDAEVEALEKARTAFVATNPQANADANIVKVSDDQYVKSGVPVAEVKDVVWNETQNGLSLGYRIMGDEWRILGRPVDVELWVRNSGDKDVKFQHEARRDIGLRMNMKGEKGAVHEASIVRDSDPPAADHLVLSPGHTVKVKKAIIVSLLWPENDISRVGGHIFTINPGAYEFQCELELPGFSRIGEGGKQFTPAEGEWTGKLTTRGLNVEVIAPDAPAPKPRIESVVVGISKDGEVSLDRKKMPLDELKTRAARNAKKWFTIQADEDVPYVKVIAVIEALKASGVTQFSFAKARVGDGKYRVANRTGSYEFDEERRFSICQPFERKQWFTVAWPAKDGQPAKSLKLYPNVSEQTRGTWAVVWEPGTDVLWWVDASDIGKMTLTDPARVIVDRKGRTTNFSRDFAVPDGVATEFRRLGFDVGGKLGERLVIGGPTNRQEILSAESVQKQPTDSTAPKSNIPDDSAPSIQPQAEQDGAQPIKTIPVTSKELSGIWYGATDRTGVVVRFIGRESRVIGTQGVVSGEWVVHVVDASIGAALEFTDDPKAGVVRITAGMWDVKTKRSYTSSLGTIERGEDDTLYLTINDNPKEPMYLSTKRIPLAFIDDREEIQRSDVEKMQSLMQTLQQKKPNNVPE